ncbi:hypothetical protein [Plebeiibacterium sediminum]|uniref:Uncharacterized protein n=1 Tax=Plebeiibacterium sediminum TaxID=2992112 RepID=A0AAE3SFR5_9BACT|nr:hypothetical protein [Plebeiobacterium sediminum]MCW3786468.1 hypothetical protein [Plebeiobacterium sediminum]
MANKNICKHKDVCQVYQGRTIENKRMLTVYKNVFCIRGYRGWQNCKEYLMFENIGPSSNINNNKLK